MGIDLRQLPLGKLAGLLNSTGLGEVTSESRVRRNVVRAGWRVGDGWQVNVLAYAAWLMSTWHAQAFPDEPSLEAMSRPVTEIRERRQRRCCVPPDPPVNLCAWDGSLDDAPAS
jgi:hypothetical protein